MNDIHRFETVLNLKLFYEAGCVGYLNDKPCFTSFDLAYDQARVVFGNAQDQKDFDKYVSNKVFNTPKVKVETQDFKVTMPLTTTKNIHYRLVFALPKEMASCRVYRKGDEVTLFPPNDEYRETLKAGIQKLKDEDDLAARTVYMSDTTYDMLVANYPNVLNGCGIEHLTTAYIVVAPNKMRVSCLKPRIKDLCTAFEEYTIHRDKQEFGAVRVKNTVYVYHKKPEATSYELTRHAVVVLTMKDGYVIRFASEQSAVDYLLAVRRQQHNREVNLATKHLECYNETNEFKHLVSSVYCILSAMDAHNSHQETTNQPNSNDATT